MDPVNEMHAAVITYFAAEKKESLLFLMTGGAAIAASLWFWITGSPLRGMGWPLVAVALIQLVVGWTVYSRTDRQARDLHTLLAKDPTSCVRAEVPRMETVQKNFRIYKAIEIVLLAAGLAGMFFLRDRQALYAASLGLALQAGLMLVFDLVAERRADVYVEQIRRLGWRCRVVGASSPRDNI
ncbi:MAG TPA: hypothetical protein VN493_29330 [Thermoanaerobaculia bacterium]|nr:hypothetical protein [Thermoanaerobaculia bacterium]